MDLKNENIVWEITKPVTWIHVRVIHIQDSVHIYINRYVHILLVYVRVHMYVHVLLVYVRVHVYFDPERLRY